MQAVLNFIISIGMIGLIIGLINPSTVKLTNRKQVGKYFGIGILITTFLSNLFTPSTPNNIDINFEKTPKQALVSTSTTRTTSPPTSTTSTINTDSQGAVPNLRKIVSTSSTSPDTSNNQKSSNLVSTTNSPAATEQLFTVTRVIDGDTIEINTGEHVRYIGVDTPETKDPRKEVQCFGKEASSRNTELVLGKKVRLEKDITDKDKYGRLLRYVYIGDAMINLELVKTGYAKTSTYPPDVKYSNLFVAAQNAAQEANLGLWGTCNTPTPTTQSSNTTASESQAANSTVNPSTQCVIKGNISATGEKIYHLPGCQSYTKTVIDESVGERWFCNETEAIQAGWRKAGNCN